MTALDPAARDVAFVFQQFSLYPHLTAYDNLAFPLRNRGVAPERIRQRVGQVAEMLEMSGQLDLRAAGLAADGSSFTSLRPPPYALGPPPAVARRPRGTPQRWRIRTVGCSAE